MRIYAAEKGIELELVPVDVMHHGLRAPEMLAKNPLATVPFLELSDGTIIRESLAIIEFLEELNPEPPMLGSTPLERARVRELDRLAEFGLMVNLGHYAHNVAPFFADRGPQSQDAARAALHHYEENLRIMDREIGVSQALLHQNIARQQDESWDQFMASVERRKRERGT